MTRRSERKARLIELAEELFNLNGFEGTTMQMLAREAGIGKASLYYYFRSKEDVFLEVLEKEMHEYKKYLERQKEEKQSYIEKLEELLLVPQKIYLAHGNILMKLFLRRQKFSFPVNRERVNSLWNFFRSTLLTVLEEGIKLKELRADLNKGNVIDIYIFNALRVMFLRLPGDEQSEIKRERSEQYEFMIDILLNGIRR